jgi:hypothetical protein
MRCYYLLFAEWKGGYIYTKSKCLYFTIEN